MRKKWRHFVLIISMMVLVVALISSCDKKEKAKKQTTLKVITVEPKATVKRLYYTGKLEPIKNIAVFSPVDGRVHKLFFIYGESVKEGQELVTINSSKLVDSYRQAVSDYLTKKATYINGIQTYQGNIALHDAGVISDSEFINDKNTYETNLLNFYQSRFELEKVLKQAGMAPKEVEALSLNDTKQLNSILEKHFKNIKVVSPGTGVALLPTKNDDSDSSSGSGGGNVGAKLTEGSNVSQNQLLLSIGNLNGLSAQLSVSETDINEIHDGLPAIITGDGFQGIELHGSVTQVSYQADPDAQSGDSGLSMFTVQVAVPKITEAQRTVIRVGMTCKVEIDIKSKPTLRVPINAVQQVDGKSQVEIQDATGKTKMVTVQTGATSVDQVEIIGGLKAGDKVVVND